MEEVILFYICLVLTIEFDLYSIPERRPYREEQGSLLGTDVAEVPRKIVCFVSSQGRAQALLENLLQYLCWDVGHRGSIVMMAPACENDDM